MRLRFWKSKAPRDPDEPKSVRWKRRGKNAAIWLAVLTVVYTLFGFFIVPLIVKHVGAPQASKRINGTIEMRKASFNPWTLAFGADGVRVLDDTGEEVLAFEKFRGDFQLIDTVFNSGFHFGKGELTAPQATLVRRPDGVINLLTIPIIPEEKTSEPIKKLPRLVIADLFVVDGGAVIKDEALTSPFEKRIADLDFEIERLDTRPTHQNDHTLSLSLGESAGITWNGATYADPLSATGRIEVTGLDIATFMPYAEGYADAEIASGTLDAVVLYDMAPAASPRRAMVTVESATVTDLSVVHGEHPILLVGAAGVDNAVADADDQNFSVANVRVDSPRVSIRRDETGAIELVDIATGVELGGAGAAPGASGSTATESAEVDLAEAPIEALRLALLKLFEDALGPWDLDVEALTIENGRIDVEDLGAPQPVSVSLTALGLQAGPVSSSEDFRVPFSLSVDVAGDNTLTCEGLLEPMSPALQASVATDGIDASWIAPYLPSELPEPLPPAKLDSLAVRLDGRATAKLDGDTATLDWNGLAELVDLAVTNADDGAPIFGGGALGADVQLNATADADGLGSATVTGSAHAEALRVELDLATPVLAAVGAASVTGIDIKLAGNSLEGASLVVAEALVEDPVLEASAPLLMPAEEPSEAESEDAPTIDLANPLAELPIELRIDTVGVRNGTLTLRNLDPEQPVELFIDEATVDLTGIATGGETIAVVDVDSRVNQSGRATVAGGFDLFRPKPYVNLTLQTQAVAIEPYEPFVGRYLGYEVESGRATITLPITIENWQVDGQLDARLNSFHLGDETGSPEAPDLPIPLGLDLLRDRNDLIRLDVPVRSDHRGPVVQRRPGDPARHPQYARQRRDRAVRAHRTDVRRRRGRRPLPCRLRAGDLRVRPGPDPEP